MGSNRNLYITEKNALRLAGIGRRGLQYQVKKGNVRAIKKPEIGRHGFSYRYHVDDVQRLGWPGIVEIAQIAGVSANSLRWRASKVNINGAVRVGGKWKFDPKKIKPILQWISDGFPVRPGFSPKEDRPGNSRNSHQASHKTQQEYNIS